MLIYSPSENEQKTERERKEQPRPSLTSPALASPLTRGRPSRCWLCESSTSKEIELLRAPKLLNGMDEKEFEAQLQEFCRFARLGFTILNQSQSQLVEVRNVLRSLGDESVSDDLLGLLASGNEKAKFLLQLTKTAKLRCEAAFDKTTSHPAAVSA
jgi:hypothetical protein